MLPFEGFPDGLCACAVAIVKLSTGNRYRLNSIERCQTREVAVKRPVKTMSHAAFDV